MINKNISSKNFDPLYHYKDEADKNPTAALKYVNKIKSFQTRHMFHLVEASQLPLLTSLSLFGLTTSIVLRWHPMPLLFFGWIDDFMLAASTFSLIVVVFCWFIQIIRESAAGHHTAPVQDGLRLGVILFIVSEIMFFFAFFWAFFHYSLAPSVAIGCTWPPAGVETVPPLGLPLVNTLLLLTSGFTLTLSHRALIGAGNSPQWAWKVFTANYLFITVLLGITFLRCQVIEYTYGVKFLIKENIYGTIFFTLTGFHGMHVVLGTVALAFCATRIIISGYISPSSPLIPFLQPFFFAFMYLNCFFMEFFSIAALSIIVFFIRILVNLASKVHNKGDKKVSDLVFAKKAIGRLGFLKKWLLLMMLQRSVIKGVWERLLPLSTDLSKFILDMNESYEMYGFTQTQHLGFEAAAWYWHFVDVVWIFLYLVLYCWGS